MCFTDEGSTKDVVQGGLIKLRVWSRLNDQTEGVVKGCNRLSCSQIPEDETESVVQGWKNRLRV